MVNVCWWLLRHFWRIVRVIVWGTPLQAGSWGAQLEDRVTAVEKLAEATRRKVYRDIKAGEADYLASTPAGGELSERVPDAAELPPGVPAGTTHGDSFWKLPT